MANESWQVDGAHSAVSLTASLNRKEFGLAWNQALETGGVLVADRVDIEIELQAIKQAAAKVG